MGKLTLNVVDTLRGRPAEGLEVSLYQIQHNDLIPITVQRTNHLGEIDTALLTPEQMSSGHYQLNINALDYFESNHFPLEAIPFIDGIVVRFGLADHSQNYQMQVRFSLSDYSVNRIQALPEPIRNTH